jgi:hypothetical protein
MTAVFSGVKYIMDGRRFLQSWRPYALRPGRGPGHPSGRPALLRCGGSRLLCLRFSTAPAAVIPAETGTVLPGYI